MSSQAPALAPALASSRAHQFYGGLTFKTDDSRIERNQNWLLARQYDKDYGRDGRSKPPSKFVRDRRRRENHGSLSCVENVVEKVESVKGEWRCVYCNITVEIDNRLNQVCCPQCQARHLEAPRRPVQGLLQAR